MNRRQFVTAVGALVLTGCGEKKPSAGRPLPVGFTEHDRCHLCGMVIRHYPGPKAEVFIKNIAEPLKFCCVRDAFTFALQPENARRLSAFYVHDLARTGWDDPSDASLMDATAAFFVYGSRRDGVMGVETVPFSSREAATRFVQEWGGSIVSYSDVTLQRLDQDR